MTLYLIILHVFCPVSTRGRDGVAEREKEIEGKLLTVDCSCRHSVFGVRITFHEAHVLVPWLERCTKKMQFPKMQSDTTSGEYTMGIRPTISTTSTDSKKKKQIGCVTLTLHLVTKAKTWLHVNLGNKYTFTPSNTSSRTKNFLSGTARSSLKGSITLFREN